MATPTKTTLTDAQRLQQARLPGGGVDLLALLGAQPEAPRMDRTWGEALQDTGLQLLEGGANIAGAVPSLVAPSSGVARWFKEQADDFGDAQSPVMQRKLRRADAQIALADQDSIIDQGVAAAKAYGADPALMARLVATNMASVIPGVGAAKAAQGVRMAQVLGAGGTAIEAATAGAKAGQLAAGATNAVLNGGDVRQDAYEDLHKTLVAKGYSPQQAQQMAEDQSWLAAGVGAATGFASGHMGLDKAVVNKGLSAGGAKAGAKAFAGELGGELLEEVSPKAATNLQAGEYDARPWSRDVGRTAVETVLGAGPFAVHAGVKEGFNKELDEGKPGEKPSDAPLLLGQHVRHIREFETHESPARLHQRQGTLVGRADVSVQDLVPVPPPHPGIELHPHVVERRAQVERRGLGMQRRDSGDLGVGQVEQEVHARIG